MLSAHCRSCHCVLCVVSIEFSVLSIRCFRYLCEHDEALCRELDVADKRADCLNRNTWIIDSTIIEYVHTEHHYTPDLSGRSFRAHNLPRHLDIWTNSIYPYDE